MKLWKKILIVVAIILSVGLLAGSIARTASSRVTSIKHANNAAASAPQVEQVEVEVNDGKIFVFMPVGFENGGYTPVVYEDGEPAEVFTVTTGSKNSNAKPADPQPVPYNVYRVTPGNSEIRFVETEAKSPVKGGSIDEAETLFCVNYVRAPIYDGEFISSVDLSEEDMEDPTVGPFEIDLGYYFIWISD